MARRIEPVQPREMLVSAYPCRVVDVATGEPACGHVGFVVQLQVGSERIDFGVPWDDAVRMAEGILALAKAHRPAGMN